MNGPAAPHEDAAEERLELLALCTEARRLARARIESRRVQIQIDGPDLYIAAVSNYNVVLDLATRRVQHGCRDFLGQAPARKLCKHVAALLLAIDPAAGALVLRGLTDPAGPWALEVIGARGFGGG